MSIPPPAAAQPTGSPAAGQGRSAGRNLPQAIGVGLGVGLVALALLEWWRPGFVALIAVVVVAAVWEMRATLRRAVDRQIVWVPAALGSAATVACAWWWGHGAQAIGLALTALAIMFVRLRRGAAGYLSDVAASIFLAVYLGGFGSFATLLVRPDDGAGRVLVFLIAVVCSDTGGYAVGALFGRHPMAPTISPKKSWEGFGGSVVTATIGAAVAMPLLLHAHWWYGAIVGAVVSLVAIAGDLAESLVKRDIGVKDMGTLVPGHGGIMDRLDSLLPGAVVGWALLSALV